MSFKRPVCVAQFSAVALSWAIFVSTTGAQQVGDRVVVSANSDTKIYDDVVGRVFEGEIRTVTAVNGKWCSLNDVEGWVPLQNVMNLDMAKKYFDKRIKSSDNQDAEALAHRGLIYYEQEDYARAFTDLNSSLRVNSRNPVTWSNRGMVLNAQQKYALAIKDLEYAIKLNPKFPHAHYNLGRVFYALNEFEKAIASYDKAIELSPKASKFYVNRGSAKLYARDFDGARADYLKALELNPREADAHVGLSNLALAKFDLQTAYQQADRAVQLQSKNAMALNARGWVLYKLGKIEEAIFDLSRAIQYAPQLPLPYNNRGVCLVAQGEHDKAIADYNRLLKLTPESAVAFANRGVAYLGKGDFAKAKADLDKAIELAPKMTDGLNSLAWFLATCPSDEFRDGKQAVEKAQLACELSDWKDWSYVGTLAAAHAELGQFDKALEFATKALELAPEESKPELKQRIEQFQAKKPVRSSVGKNSEF